MAETERPKECPPDEMDLPDNDDDLANEDFGENDDKVPFEKGENAVDDEDDEDDEGDDIDGEENEDQWELPDPYEDSIPDTYPDQPPPTEVEKDLTVPESLPEALGQTNGKILPVSASNVTTGCHLMATCSNNPDLQPNKKIKLSPILRRELLSTTFRNNFHCNWQEDCSVICDNFELIASPFKVCVIKDLIDDPRMLDELRRELYEVNFSMRNMDLYEFFQSKDLQYLTSSELVRNMYEFLKTDVMKWVAKLTGYNLTHISATCSLYSNTDYLLVHDDQREDRMVAFILYLTDGYGWEKCDGGCLDLFSKDSDGQPLQIVRSIIPVNNQLIFFPVTNDSYHQVSEITSLNKYRLSINGWFHTRKPPVFETPIYQSPEDGLYSKNSKQSKYVDISLESWISDEYLEKNAIKLIQQHIEENSEISLKSFFKAESFEEILSNLQRHDISWNKVGPLNRYCYEVADLSTLPHIIERFVDLFQSEQMFHLLQLYTDLELDNKNASMKFELQRWTPGNYALLTEYNWKEKNELDIIIYFGCKDVSDVIGARTLYVTIEDEVQNALITIEPEENNLNIVYRDSARFTKYFSKQSKCQCFYTFICSYSE